MKDETILKSSHSIKQRTLPVLNMSCASCAASVGSILTSQPGVISAVVNYANSSTTISYDPTLTGLEELQNAVRSVGYDLVVEQGQAGQEVLEEKTTIAFQRLKQNTVGAFILTLPLVVISMGFPSLPYAAYIMWLLATPVLLVYGRRFFKGAYQQLKIGKANMDTLVALSTGTAYIYSLVITITNSFWPGALNLPHHVYFESAAVIICFILLGKYLEERARHQTSADIKKLMGLQPQTATLLIDGAQQVIQVAAIKAQDKLLVKPGEAIAVDGIITSGQPFIDERMISGEPISLQKVSGDTVFAGTLNQSSAFEMQAHKVGTDTVLAGIIALVKQAQGSKAPIQHLVDKIAARFVVFVVAVAILSFGIWWLSGANNAFTQGLISFVTVLVIACPCALGLATPAAIMVGIGKAAGQGILIKDAESLQTSTKITDVVLDKTGTLTDGKPIVSQMIWLSDNKDNNIGAAIFAAMEQQSQHPLAPAIVQHLDQNKAIRIGQDKAINLEHTELIPGEGIQTTFKGKKYYAGNTRLLKNQSIGQTETAEAQSKLDAFLNHHGEETLVYFTNEKNILACVALSDPLSFSAMEAITNLRKQKINIHMLTGDNEPSAKKIATETGITQYKAQMLPEDKLVYIRQLKASGAKVAMIGDGINDSAALAEADISMAMAHGSAIAIDVAKITLVGGDLRKIPAAIKISKQTNKTIKENLFWAFIYNIIGIPIAAGILFPFNGFMLNPMIAGAAMALSSVSVLVNSLRLKYKRL